MSAIPHVLLVPSHNNLIEHEHLDFLIDVKSLIGYCL